MKDISRHIRLLYGLPATGPTGLSDKERQFILCLEGRIRSDQGKNAELRFLEAWSDKQYYPIGLASVRAATIEEDIEEKTDAVMILTNSIQIRIQIKSGKKIGYLTVMRFAEDFRIVLVQVLPEDSAEVIRRKTLRSIKLANRKLLRIQSKKL